MEGSFYSISLQHLDTGRNKERKVTGRVVVTAVNDEIEQPMGQVRNQRILLSTAIQQNFPQ